MNAKHILSLGLLLLVVSWSLKQCTASLAASNLSGSLASQSVSADEQAEIADETEEWEIKIAEERVKDEPDRDDIKEWNEKIDEKSQEIRKEYTVEKAEARIDAKQDSADAMNWFRRFLTLKLWLDIVKIAGVVLLLFGSIKIMEDESTTPAMRWFSVGAAVVTLFSILVGGLFSFLS